MMKILKKLKKVNILVALLVLLSFMLISTFGRFVYVEIRDNFFTSETFFFNSDKLTEEHAVFQIENYNGVDPYDIIINLNTLDNNLLKTNIDVDYEVTYSCSANANCSVTKEEGTIYAGNNTDFFLATITPTTNLEDQDEIYIEVEVTSTSPYITTLSGEFTLRVGHFGLSHRIDDRYGDPYINLNVTNTLDFYRVLEPFGSYSEGDYIDIETYLSLSDNDRDNCYSAVVELNFDPEVLRLNMTSDIYFNALDYSIINIEGNDYINYISFKIDAITSERIKFYKVDANNNYSYPLYNLDSIVDVNYITEYEGPTLAPPQGGIVLHLDSYQLLHLSDGAPLTEWSDMSGNNNDATQSISGRIPTYRFTSEPYVSFSEDYLETSLNDEVDNFHAVSSNSWTNSVVFRHNGQDGIIAGAAGGIGGATTFAIYMQNGDVRVRLRGDTDASLQTVGSNIEQGVWHHLIVTWDGTNARGYLNGGTAVELPVGSSGNQGYNYFIGSSRNDLTNYPYFTGDIAENIVYDGVLSSNRRQDLQQYISSKW